MIRAVLHRLTLLAAALLVAVVSVHSAARMAPDLSDRPEALAWATVGVQIDDLCGDTGTHEHHCPFCRLLSDPPQAEIAPRRARLALIPAWTGLARDLTRGRQHANPAVSARGPPATA